MSPSKGGVGEGLPGQPLTVVEAPVYGQGVDVGPGGGELDPLLPADSSPWEQNDDTSPGNVLECRRHSPSRVSRGGGEDGTDPSVVLSLQGGQKVGHDTGTHILEGQGGAVEELQKEGGRRDPCKGKGEGEGFPADSLQGGQGDSSLAPDEVVEDECPRPDRIRPVTSDPDLDLLQESRREGGKGFGMVESSIGGHSGQEGGGEVNGGTLLGRGAEDHGQAIMIQGRSRVGVGQEWEEGRR